MEVGVHIHKSIIDFSGVNDYLKQLLREEGPNIEPESSEALGESLRVLLEGSHIDYFETLTSTLTTFAYYCKQPLDLKRLFVREIQVDDDTTFMDENPTPIFDSRIVPEIKDVIFVEKNEVNNNRWFFEVSSIGESGISVFKKDLGEIPPLAKSMKVIKEGGQFSSRYVFRPYVLALKLWLTDEVSVSIASDLKSFLSGATNYIFSNEWRTSIVLSAIAVESILADLYEENYKSPAPDVPLGELFGQVKKMVKFPDNVLSAIDTTNQARIAAVHRSRLPVSQRDAINALFGAVVVTQHYACIS